MDTPSKQVSCDFIGLAKTTIHTEKNALDALIAALDDNFSRACNAILHCQGRVVVTGMGKSGHIGRKISATFASTGTPSFFMHPAEAGHGDLGMLVANDVLIAISNSGESNEICTLLPVIKRLNIPLISISRSKFGSLPTAADIVLTLGDSDEACPLGLAPTSSTTATLALGDALAVALVYARGFTKGDFALSHPAGALGRQLLTSVSDLMQTQNLPCVLAQTPLYDVLVTMTSGRLGLAIVMDNEAVVGIFTDGDLRRYLAHHSDLSVRIGTIMTKNPKTINPSCKATDALAQMRQQQINHLLVLDTKNPANNQPVNQNLANNPPTAHLVGVISLHHLAAAKIF